MSRCTRSLLALATLSLLGNPIAAPAQQATMPIVILFLGDSFFHGAFQPVMTYNHTTVTDENAAMAAV